VRTPSHPMRMEVPLTYYSAAKLTRTLSSSEFAFGGLVRVLTLELTHASSSCSKDLTGCLQINTLLVCQKSRVGAREFTFVVCGLMAVVGLPGPINEKTARSKNP
jgi:hypothetical protein